MSASARPSIPRSIYAITHRPYCGLSNTAQIDRLVAAGARLIQLRDKDLRDESLVAEARVCAERCRRAGALLILNDDPRAAVLANAHGAHIGQDDMPAAEARRILGPDRILGLSTHNDRQFDEALKEPVDYIAVGPVFGTATKANPDPATGLELVERAWRVLGGRKPLVAIGGIDRHNLPRLLERAPGVIPAIIGGVMKAPDIGIAWRELNRMLPADPAA